MLTKATNIIHAKKRIENFNFSPEQKIPIIVSDKVEEINIKGGKSVRIVGQNGNSILDKQINAENCDSLQLFNIKANIKGNNIKKIIAGGSILDLNINNQEEFKLSCVSESLISGEIESKKSVGENIIEYNAQNIGDFLEVIKNKLSYSTIKIKNIDEIITKELYCDIEKIKKIDDEIWGKIYNKINPKIKDAKEMADEFNFVIKNNTLLEKKYEEEIIDIKIAEDMSYEKLNNCIKNINKEIKKVGEILKI